MIDFVKEMMVPLEIRISVYCARLNIDWEIVEDFAISPLLLDFASFQGSFKAGRPCLMHVMGVYLN